MEHLEVTPSRLAAAADAITAAASAIDAELSDLDATARALEGLWTGEARDAYETAHGRFTQAMRSRTALVREIDEALAALAQTYSDADLAAARALGVHA